MDLLLFWDRIVAMCAPWMTAGYSLCAEPDALDYTPFLNGFNRVVRTRRCVSAMHTEQWRQR